MTAALQRFVVSAEQAGQRLDRYLAALVPSLSRTRIQELIREGHVQVNGRPARPALRLEAGQVIEARLLPRPPLTAAPEPIPLRILYEDEDVVAVDKPAGLVVHPAPGHPQSTLVNALVHRYGQLSTLGGPTRPGIVHRLDRGTSGVLLVVRHDEAHRHLARQFARRTVEKLYLALVHGQFKQLQGVIRLPVARDRRLPRRMTTRRREGRAAETSWQVLACWTGLTLLAVRLHTGRTHQVRVHFSALGHPVVGDTLYGAPRQIVLGGQRLAAPARPFLHAARIGFTHPRTGQWLEISAPLAEDLEQWLRQALAVAGVDPAQIDRVLSPFL